MAQFFVFPSDSDFGVDCTRFRQNHMVFRGDEKGGGGLGSFAPTEYKAGDYRKLNVS